MRSGAGRARRRARAAVLVGLALLVGSHAALAVGLEHLVPELRDPEYVAPMTVWLCTDAAWNVNGKIFHVAGGSISLAHEEDAQATIVKNGIWTIDELAGLVPEASMTARQHEENPFGRRER